MKISISNICLLFFIIFSHAIIAQQYFKDTWFGFKSGEYTNGRFPLVADIGDLNNDGHNDIVIGQFALDPGFKVVFSNGDGTFNLPTHYPTIKGTECIRIADLNNDGNNDIVLTNSGTFNGFGDDPQNWEWGNSISVFRNNGNGTFTAHQEIITALHPERLEIADFNNDGDIDIAVANFGRAGIPGNTVTILENNGAGTFSVMQNIVVPNFPFRVSAGKINNDNLIDLVVGHESSARSILINNGNGFNAPIPFGGISPSGYNLGTNMDAVDINNDGSDDLVFFDSWGSSTDLINIYKNDGNGNFSTYEEYNYPTWLGSGDQCYYADLDNDGWLDIVSASFNGQSGRGFFIFESNGTGGFLPAKVYSSGMGSSAALCDDVNQDGLKDVFIVDYSMSINVHLNKGDATFPLSPLYPIEGSSEDIDAADIDLDGDIDIITSSDDGVATDISVLLNNGEGTFPGHFTISRTGNDHGGAHAKLRDMNGNGYPDVLFLSPSNNLSYQAFIAFNNTNGGFNYPITLPVASCGWGDVDAVDIDNDGDLDIVISEFLACVSIPESGKRLYFLKNNGDDTFQPPYVKIIGANPRSFTTGDFNQDGKIDLATAHYGPYGYRNFIQILIGDGTGNFAEPVTKIVGYGPHDIITADFNNDGILDIATGNTGTDGIGAETMSVLLGSGNGTFQNAVTYDAPYSSLLLGVSGMKAADIDHDGDLDILLANQPGGDLAVYINDSNGNFQHLYRVGTSFRPSGIVYEDFTGNDIKDIAVICSPATSGVGLNYVNILEGIGEVVPVELISFAALVTGTKVQLNWSTASETNNQGFEIQRLNDYKTRSEDWDVIEFVKGNGITTETSAYSFIDEVSFGRYLYRLKQIDFDGTFEYSNEIEVEVLTPDKFSLRQNYPNPFNPSTKITFSLPEASLVKLSVFNILGEEVKTLLNENKVAGRHTIEFNANGFSSGIYFYKIHTGNFNQVRKMILSK